MILHEFAELIVVGIRISEHRKLKDPVGDTSKLTVDIVHPLSILFECHGKGVRVVSMNSIFACSRKGQCEQLQP